ncbi:thioredoxin domain-containing protein [Tahibacter soli]|jgi:protein-disulfide isomerase|uniref:Thioredoxin domain-containing protein n=1 Tax=Tahibacter soli TaxID=2983605 RepID=A0A9X3YK24_9GAMM|nr:thioredoxin domain-containing protein [Tahibacter soli]MDC8012635.1 thioredoxin domain-containing protein [Tahibacter soli]
MSLRFAFACRFVFLAAAALPAAAQTPAPPEPPAPPLHQQIVANLVFQFPQLANAGPSVESLSPPGVDGLRTGTLKFDKGRTQQFMLSERGTLYLLQGKPIEILDVAALDAAKAQREQTQAKEAAERHAQLAKATAGVAHRGNAKAKITLVEFSDYQCPYCARASKAVDELLAARGADVRYVVMPFPLDSIHPWARNAALAAQCAQQQKADAFWALNDAYYNQQGTFNKDNVLPKSRELVAAAKLDLKRWDACVGNPESKDYASALAAIDASVALGRAIGVNATPSFYVNGRKFAGVPSAQALANYLADAPGAAQGAPKP